MEPVVTGRAVEIGTLQGHRPQQRLHRTRARRPRRQEALTLGASRLWCRQQRAMAAFDEGLHQGRGESGALLRDRVGDLHPRGAQLPGWVMPASSRSTNASRVSCARSRPRSHSCRCSKGARERIAVITPLLGQGRGAGRGGSGHRQQVTGKYTHTSRNPAMTIAQGALDSRPGVPQQIARPHPPRGPPLPPCCPLSLLALLFWTDASGRTTMDCRSVWQYLAPMDRETFVSGTISWLLDPRGDHGLGDRLLSALLSRLGYSTQDSEGGQPPETCVGLEVKPEIVDHNKRFDISVFDGGRHIAVFEVKCKTFGSRSQLRDYAEEIPFLGRIAFGEWNFPDLCDKERVAYPLIAFTDLAHTIRELASTEGTSLVRSFAEHLLIEAGFFMGMRAYLIDETEPSPPQLPTVHRFSDRFCNQLFWHWFQERCDTDDMLAGFDSDTRSEQSGVWFAIGGHSFTVSGEAVFPELGLKLPGQFYYWIHIELDNGTGILSQQGEQVGSIQVRIKDDDGSRDDLFSAVQDASVAYGFQSPGRRPRSSDGYWTALKKPLKLEDFRYSSLHALIRLLALQ